ncbi:hypothetical protein A2W54_03885 [Candidatus Giovannonibacteria bacterium RIFCSPHIGHO2_02_43_13]|uniref:Transcription regulator TrmB N-terminal domain-containing protein n=1 Tax=Candidatus Giovannonibacteria bacterium RIFCSPHIGHO2_02_43_13 TaxID=1798330 RepID=A0A1F5WRC0_9BACT|nr:MAG: Transcriptional regulator, TrmB [Parcubacteria group bacterium GW2011_GWA2_44_13]OGF74661.1 MAG: hypothetical protein A3E06_02995 [Candidatus Giovannonibacteria bacterium RIFCSPHIGHO2_12_FULL_44_42]OGF78216.1 MAG: hypothetical protein A2W54_03885 [Candidatus Giovannonibacteria bacterium RIFCSPHIGHO2_02_43_13]OGF90082.1 MAG: hypothetical protein A3I94_03100 [Candidatus Giovannonibacteria bacterium RIFCSPLOWO2_02_FULL_43_54]OGF96623.1 MAG: hypothetical protein A3H08_01640 [Candidatus Giov
MLDELKKIGLSENEAEVYIALLELGSATAQEIAAKSGIKRTTIYVQIEALLKIGLVSSFEKEMSKGKVPKTYFRAEDPENLKRVVEKEKSTTQEKEDSLKKTLPDLERLFLSSGERPRVRFFEGVEGLNAMQDEFLKTKDNLVETISSLDDVLRIFPQHPEKNTPRRIKRHIASKLIYTSSRGPFLEKENKEMLRETRYFPPDKFHFSCDIAIYGNIVAISSLRGEPFGIIIESEQIANSMRSMFYLAWKGADK